MAGNVRELQNVIRNIVVLNSGEEVTLQMVPPPISEISGAEIASPLRIASGVQISTIAQNDISHTEPIERTAIEPLWVVEKRAIQAAIDACDGNIPRAAGFLEVSPSTIYRKLQAWQDAVGSNREID